MNIPRKVNGCSKIARELYWLYSTMGNPKMSIFKSHFFKKAWSGHYIEFNHFLNIIFLND